MAENSATTRSKRRRRVDEIARLFGNAHVFPSKEKWAAQKGMSYRTFGTQAEAIKYAERVAKLTDSVNKKTRKHRLAQPLAARVRGRSGTFRIPVPRSGYPSSSSRKEWQNHPDPLGNPRPTTARYSSIAQLILITLHFFTRSFSPSENVG
jgi:hypothetical protein